jgi:type I restriction enzyme S subunit
MGSVVLLRDAGIGKSAVLGADMAVSQHFMAWNCGPRLDNWYLYYYLQYMKPEFERISNGSTIKTIGLDYFRQFEIPLPMIEEQRLIAQVLRDVDDLVDMLEKALAKKQAVKQGMMQQLLTGKIRLPGFQAKWATAPLKEFLPLQRGFDLPTSQLRPGPYPVVYSNGVARHHAKAMVSGPGVVTGRSGTIGKVHYVEQDYWPHNTSLWVTSFARVEAVFAYYFLSYLGLERFASGSGVPTFNRNDAHSFPVSLPTDRGEQAAIAEVLRGADTELSALTKRLAKAREVKQGMMQQLLTGHTRLPVKESAA